MPEAQSASPEPHETATVGIGCNPEVPEIGADRPLAQSVAIVTGASRGIGRAIAIVLGKLGARVVVNYRQGAEAADETVRALAEVGASGCVIQADVAERAAVDRLVAETHERFGRIDILVHNAAVQRPALLHKMTDEDWHTVLGVTLSGAFYLSRAVLPIMLDQKRGHILHVGSISGAIALPLRGAANYIAAKHGLVGLTKALAMETAGTGVLVNAVNPGVTDTDMIGALSEKQRERLLAHVPLGRMARPEEIARTVGWILAYTTYSTGSVFDATGGAVMG